MRYALVSDIHANEQAWDAVLADTVKAGVDGIICLGDIVGYGPRPARVLESVYEHTDMFLLGNHDAVICGRFDSDCFNDEAREIIEWTGRQLNKSAIDFFNQVPMMILGDTFALSHAEFEVPERFDYIYDPAEAMESFQAVEQQFLFCGHTHFPGTIRLLPDGRSDYRKPAGFKMEEGFRYLVNVGSVGDPRNGDTRASYVIYDLEQESVDFRNVPFDIGAYRLDIEHAGIPTKPVLFDYADALTPVETVTQVREFHVDDDAVARATAAEEAVGLQRVDTSALQSRRKLVVSAGTMGDEISFRSSSAGRYHKSDRKRLAVTLGICLGSLLIIGIALAWSALNRGAPVPTPKVVAPVKPVRPISPERADPKPDADPVETSLTKGLVLYWDFNQESSIDTNYVRITNTDRVIDDSGKGLDGVLDGPERIAGVRGRAISFRGEGHVKIEDTSQPTLPYDQPWSVAMWYKWAPGGGILFAKVADGQKPGYYARITKDGIFEWRHMHKYKEKRIKIVAKTDMRDLSSEQGWRHIILQYDGSMKAKGVVLYVDGKEQAYDIKHDGLDGPSVNSVPFFLGTNAKGDSRLNGGLDEFRIYNRTLNEAEIRRLGDANRVVPDGGVIAQQGAGSRVDDEIIAGIRADFALIKQDVLAADFDPSGAIQSLQGMGKKVVGTTLEADIKRVIEELNADVKQGKADVMRTLEARVIPLIDAGNYGEAVDLYNDYVGSFKAETLSLRHARAVTLKNQATVATQEIQRTHKKLNIHLHETFVEDLLDQRFDVVFEARSDVELEYPALAATPAFKDLAKEVDELKKIRGLVQSKQVNLNADTSDAATFYKGVVLTASSTPEKARPFLEKVDQFQLARSMASRLELVQQEREEEAVHARMVEFRSRLGVPADLTNPAKIRECIFARSISGVALKAHRKQAVKARELLGTSPAFKQHEPFIEVLETMRVPVSIRAFTKALGVISMTSNKIRRTSDGWGLLNEGLRRSEGVISGSPQVNSSEGGKLFTFTGSNHISFKDGVGIKENSDWTVTFWANPEAGQADGTMIVLGVAQGNNSSCLMGIKASTFHLAAPNKSATGGVVKANTWQHHVIMHEGSKTTWLVDGKEIVKLDQALNLNNYLIVGGLMDNAGTVKQRFKGQLKDIHIYNRTLDARAMAQLTAAVRSTL